ncbi:MAG: hypothetical protein ACPGLV_02315 [Bacteroidia bacterium]
MIYKDYYQYDEKKVFKLLSSNRYNDIVDGTMYTLFGLGDYAKSEYLLKTHLVSENDEIKTFGFRQITHLVRIYKILDLDFFAPLIEKEISRNEAIEEDDLQDILWDLWCFLEVKTSMHFNLDISKQITSTLEFKNELLNKCSASEYNMVNVLRIHSVGRNNGSLEDLRKALLNNGFENKLLLRIIDSYNY